jgi:hypothetical protein
LDTGVTLTPAQQGFLEVVREVCRERGGDRFTVVSEWEGYLPFPMTISVEGVASSRFSAPWDSGDLEALVTAGRLEELERRVQGEATQFVYRLVEGGPPHR